MAKYSLIHAIPVTLVLRAQNIKAINVEQLASKEKLYVCKKIVRTDLVGKVFRVCTRLSGRKQRTGCKYYGRAKGDNLVSPAVFRRAHFHRCHSVRTTVRTGASERHHDVSTATNIRTEHL